MKKSTFLCLAMLALSPLAAWGEAPSPSHRQAATELLKAMDLEKVMLAAANAMLDAQIQGNPALAPYRDVLQTWMEKYLTMDALGPRMAELYVGAFTEAELRELIAFYKTPTGQKALTTMPALMQKGAQIGMEVAKEHQAELEGMIRARKEELDKAKKP